MTAPVASEATPCGLTDTRCTDCYGNSVCPWTSPVGDADHEIVRRFALAFDKADVDSDMAISIGGEMHVMLVDPTPQGIATTAVIAAQAGASALHNHHKGGGSEMLWRAA